MYATGEHCGKSPLGTVHYLGGGGLVGLWVGQSFKNRFGGWANVIINKERRGPT